MQGKQAERLACRIPELSNLPQISHKRLILLRPPYYQASKAIRTSFLFASVLKVGGWNFLFKPQRDFSVSPVSEAIEDKLKNGKGYDGVA